MIRRLLLASIALLLAAPAAAAHGPSGHTSTATHGGAAGHGAVLQRTRGVLHKALGTELGALGPSTVATILDVSDFHGRLEPAPPIIDAGGERFGGLAYLKTYFDQRAALSPNKPFIVTAGDEVGATPPISALLGDRPTIELMNDVGFDANTLGNHNFDSGVDHMAGLAARADFPYVVANLVEPDGTEPDWTQRYAIWEVDGVRIGVTGVINEDARDLVREGGLGDLEIRDASESIDGVVGELRDDHDVHAVIVLAHIGGDPFRADRGDLYELAGELEGVDLLVGDHTYWQVNEPVPGKKGEPVWVVQSFPQGVSFTEVRLTLSKLTGEVLAVAGDQFPATARGTAPDPLIQAKIDTYRELAARSDRVVGHSRVGMPRNLARAEANQGNFLADAMRWSTGAELAIVNSGTLRASFTAQKDGTGNFPITSSRILEVLPFGNIAVELTVSGTELRQILEHGVGLIPRSDGRFPQISGFEFDFRTTLPPGSRVVAARRPDDTPLPLTGDVHYTLTMSNYQVTGGDGYPRFGGYTAGDSLDGLVTKYLEAHTPVHPPGPIPPLEAPSTRIHKLD